MNMQHRLLAPRHPQQISGHLCPPTPSRSSKFLGPIRQQIPAIDSLILSRMLFDIIKIALLISFANTCFIVNLAASIAALKTLEAIPGKINK